MNRLTKKVLIIEDELSELEVLVKRLSLDGYDVLQASDGDEGLKIALEEHPDLMLLDVMMPRMDGLTMLEMLRQDSWGKNVPVIIFTNLTLEDKILTRVVKSEPSYYFVKADMDIDDVVKKVGEVLDMQ